MADEASPGIGSGSAADLLSAWRAAERDRVAAEEAAGVAALAAVAAAEAAAAAAETSEAAKLSLEAAQRADMAAQRTSAAAILASKVATRERDTAADTVSDARHSEDVARDAFRKAQDEGFPKG